MIRVHELTRKFGAFAAIDSLTFNIEPGEIFAFLGPNGAGKTTTLKILTTLLRQTSGVVEIDGMNTLRHSAAVRRKFGIVFQEQSLDPDLTPRENMHLHAALYGMTKQSRIQHTDFLLNAFDLLDQSERMVKQLSGGIRRRIEVARALLHRPRIIFLDEPTIGLDPQSRISLWSLLRERNKQDGVTVFLTTHHMEEADKVASRIAIINHARLVCIGTSLELKQQTQMSSLEEAFLKLTSASVEQKGSSRAQSRETSQWTVE